MCSISIKNSNRFARILGAVKISTKNKYQWYKRETLSIFTFLPLRRLKNCICSTRFQISHFSIHSVRASSQVSSLAGCNHKFVFLVGGVEKCKKKNREWSKIYGKNYFKMTKMVNFAHFFLSTPSQTQFSCTFPSILPFLDLASHITTPSLIFTRLGVKSPTPQA